MRGFLLALIVAAALILVPYLVLPTFLENLVARDVQDRLGLPETPTVDLQSDPGWEMLRGRFSGGRISAGNLDLGGVRAERAEIVVDDPFKVNLLASITDRRIVTRDRPPGRLRLEISESEVARLVGDNSDLPINGLDLGEDGVTVESESTALGVTIPVIVEGEVGVRGRNLVFEPRTVEAAGMVLPGWVAEGMLAGGAFDRPVGDLPYGATITGVRPTDGSIVITGHVPAVDLDALPAG